MVNSTIRALGACASTSAAEAGFSCRKAAKVAAPTTAPRILPRTPRREAASKDVEEQMETLCGKHGPTKACVAPAVRKASNRAWQVKIDLIV